VIFLRSKKKFRRLAGDGKQIVPFKSITTLVVKFKKALNEEFRNSRKKH
jgi:hypothetical protein